jgi:hypothetical protein
MIISLKSVKRLVRSDSVCLVPADKSSQESSVECLQLLSLYERGFVANSSLARAHNSGFDNIVRMIWPFAFAKLLSKYLLKKHQNLPDNALRLTKSLLGRFR